MTEPAKSHEAHVASQFGARAGEYVASAAHASGEDLGLLARLAEDRPGCRILDLGCGGGHVAYAVAPHAREVVAYDLSPEMLEAVSTETRRRGLDNIVIRQGDVAVLPFSDESFDLVLSRFSAHHWGDVPGALREARRVLKPEGLFALSDGIGPADPLCDTHLQAWELLRDPSHVRDYSEAEWRSMLGESGFVPGKARHHRLRLDFASWIARMRTPETNLAAIRALQASAPDRVREHFGLEPDGSFALEVLTITAEPDSV